ncbi:MAG TPA: tetratricopeptide repeat protein [Kofleriaceae bacterium]
MLALVVTRAYAQPSPGPAPAPAEARPWAAGVSETEQANATELYVAGNREYSELRFAQALAKYKEAIAHWDHPAIRYNMAICLINLDQLIEARDNLERSLAYGAAPLDGDKYGQGLSYRKLLEARLAHLALTCGEPGADVTLDGKLLFTGPGTVERFVLPGEHQVVATKRGFLTVSRILVGDAGKLTTLDITPALEHLPATRMVRRWDAWKPWVVLAGGSALIGIGALSYRAAAHDLTAYDDGVAMYCPKGCGPVMLGEVPGLSARLDSVNREQTVAFTLFAVGGAAVVSGVLGVILNQPRMQLETSRTQPIVTLVRAGATASVRGRF